MVSEEDGTKTTKKEGGDVTENELYAPPPPPRPVWLFLSFVSRQEQTSESLGVAILENHADAQKLLQGQRSRRTAVVWCMRVAAVIANGRREFEHSYDSFTFN